MNLFLVQGFPPKGVKSPDCRALSRLAESFSEEAHVTSYMIARRFSKSLLHDEIASRSWRAFERGEYDSAILQAMKAVEIEVRSASGLEDRDGVKLISSAFAPQKDNKPDCGPLTDKEVNTAEQSGRLQLFAGTYSSYRNPTAHRDFSIDSPEEAIEILMIASHLLRIVDVRKTAIAQEHSVQSVSAEGSEDV
ncbi:TIGR02391 family protein [Zymomonas mobilis]|uniref:TIGR02391 family protein n=1 Tax=Zymomonas mobilis TaxID=542 RepID=UPI0011511F9B|nr:TIGR02391 family protein [Zymomonas mobilis]